jgi:putative intracellular protease/amidase
MGTPDYIAPEQANDSGRVDIRADIYSLGCTLYFLLAGRPPFPGGTALEKMLSHADRTPRPLTELCPDLPPGLAEVVGRMMAKNADGRFATPADVARALAPYKATPARKAGPEEAARPRPPGEVAAVQPAAPAERTLPLRRRPRSPRGQPSFLWRFRGPTGVVALVLATALGAVLAVKALRPGLTPVAEPQDGGPGAAVDLPVLVVLPPEFDGADYDAVRAVLEGEGKRRVTVASSQATAQPMDGRPSVRADLRLGADEVHAANFAAIVFIGGRIVPFKDDARVKRRLRQLLADARAARRYVAALARGQGVLFITDTLPGRRVAANRELINNAGDCGAIWVHESVVVDGLIVTGGEPTDAAPFARGLLRCLDGRR